MRRFIQQGDATIGTVNVDIPKGRYAGLFVRLQGLTDAGETLTLADIGHIRIMRHGEELISESFEFFHEYDDLKGGYLPAPTGVAASAEDVMAFIPFSLPELPNVANVKSNEEMDLKLEFLDFSTLFGANPVTFQVYGYLTPNIAENYHLIIREQDIQASGAGRKPEVLNGHNLACMYLRDIADVIDSYSLIVDNDVKVDNIDDDVERAVTTFENQVETTHNMAEVNLARTGSIAEVLNSMAKIELVFNALGTAEITVFQIKPVGKS